MIKALILAALVAQASALELEKRTSIERKKEADGRDFWLLNSAQCKIDHTNHCESKGGPGGICKWKVRTYDPICHPNEKCAKS